MVPEPVGAAAADVDVDVVAAEQQIVRMRKREDSTMATYVLRHNIGRQAGGWYLHGIERAARRANILGTYSHC